MLSGDDAPPVDRPNLSKDYLAGNAPEDWVPLRPDSFYAENGIDLRLRRPSPLSIRDRAQVALAGGTALRYDRLLSGDGRRAGALVDPRRRTRRRCASLRTLADCRALSSAPRLRAVPSCSARASSGSRSPQPFARVEIEVHVVAPDKRPLERVLGPQLGDFVRALHEEHGVVFHLEHAAPRLTANTSNSRAGTVLEADLVVAGVGVRPRVELAERAGLRIDRGVVVDAHLETTAPGVFAAGDIARWPDPRTRRGHSRRALGGRRASGTDRGAQYARPPRDIRRCSRSSGASTTTFRSTTSVTPRHGTNWRSRATLPAKTAWFASGATGARWLSPRSFVTSRACRRNLRWNEVPIR